MHMLHRDAFGAVLEKEQPTQPQHQQLHYGNLTVQYLHTNIAHRLDTIMASVQVIVVHA